MANGKISGDPVATTTTGLVMAGVQAGENVQVPESLFLQPGPIPMFTKTGDFTVDTTMDAGIVLVNKATTVSATLPGTISEGFTATFIQIGAGAIQFTAGSGASMKSFTGFYVSGGQDAVTSVLVRSNTDDLSGVWQVTGDLVA